MGRIVSVAHATLLFSRRILSELYVRLEVLVRGMEDGRSMTTFYYCSVNHQSGLQRNTFSKLSYTFFNTSKCASNYSI